MLDLLSGGNHQGVARCVVVRFAHHRLPFVEQPLHAFALLAARRHFELFEYLFEALDLLFGLPQVLFECLSELVARRLLRHLGQRFGDLLLSVVDVFQLVLEKFFERFDTGHTRVPPLKKIRARQNASAKARVMRSRSQHGRLPYCRARSVHYVHLIG